MRISLQGRVVNYHKHVRIFANKGQLVFRDRNIQLKFPLQVEFRQTSKEIIRYIKSCYQRGFRRLNLNHYLDNAVSLV